MIAFSLFFWIQQEQWTCEIVIIFSFLMKKHSKSYWFYFWEILATCFILWTVAAKGCINLWDFFLVIFFLFLFLRFCLGKSCFKNSLLFDCKLDVSQLNFWIWKKMQHQLLWNYNGMKPSKHSLKGLLTSSKIRWGVNHWTTICGLRWNI